MGIGAKNLQIHAIQLTTNKISDLPVLGDLLDQIPFQIDKHSCDFTKIIASHAKNFIKKAS